MRDQDGYVYFITINNIQQVSPGNMCYNMCNDMFYNMVVNRPCNSGTGTGRVLWLQANPLAQVTNIPSGVCPVHLLLLPGVLAVYCGAAGVCSMSIKRISLDKCVVLLFYACNALRMLSTCSSR
jgi:hypothetical protein